MTERQKKIRKKEKHSQWKSELEKRSSNFMTTLEKISKISKVFEKEERTRGGE